MEMRKLVLEGERVNRDSFASQDLVKVTKIYSPFFENAIVGLLRASDEHVPKLA